MTTEMTNSNYQISFYVPPSHCEAVKQAMFEAGAGTLGQYACCAWQTKGQGQFMPLTGSNPFLGHTDELEQVDEYKVEMLCSESRIQAAIIAMKQAHPYEEPAYAVIKLEPF